MKPLLTFAALALILGAGAVAVSETPSEAMDKMMAEMKNCDVCKSMADKEALMQNSTWETHKIDNGMLCVMTVPKEYMSEFKSCHALMMKNYEQVKADEAAGKEVHLCSFCKSMADLEKAGAKQQEIKTETGAVNLMTSNDPGVVQQIHATADHAIEMQKQIKAMHASVH